MTHRATCRVTPRQLNEMPRGWCHVRLNSHITVATAPIGQLCSMYCQMLTWATGALKVKDSTGAMNSATVLSDQNVYQVCTKTNCRPCRSVYRGSSRGV